MWVQEKAELWPKIGLEISENHEILMKNGAKMGSGPHLGRRWVQGSKKGANTHFSKLILGVIFVTLGHLFRCFFLVLFWKASFSPLVRLLGAKGAQKAPKMEPKWSRKRDRGYPLGSVKSMAGAMFSAHKGVSGRVREATFSRLGLQTHSGGVLGSILGDFRRFWLPCGVHFGSILGLKRRLFSGPNFSQF